MAPFIYCSDCREHDYAVNHENHNTILISDMVPIGDEVEYDLGESGA